MKRVPDFDNEQCAPPPPLRVDAALAIVRAHLRQLRPVSMPAEQAAGHVLAEPVIAPRAIPAFRNSAMDGFAIRTRETSTASPTRPLKLNVTGAIAAGDPMPGEQAEFLGAMRIMTGAPVPAGFDAVVPLELVTFDQGCIVLDQPWSAGTNIREAGSEVEIGASVLNAGRLIAWPEIGLLALLGIGAVTVHPAPRLAIISTGDEIVASGERMDAWSVPDCNGPMLSAMAASEGAVPIFAGISRDSASSLHAVLASVGQVDAIVISGGVSAGDYDVVRQVLRHDGEVLFAQVKIKPGRPVAFGRVNGVPVFALPGNPIAAAVTFEQFVRPAIRRMRGIVDDDRPVRLVQAGFTIANERCRRLVIPVRLQVGDSGAVVAHEIAGARKGGFAALADSQALLVVSEETRHVSPGDLLPCWPIRQRSH